MEMGVALLTITTNDSLEVLVLDLRHLLGGLSSKGRNAFTMKRNNDSTDL